MFFIGMIHAVGGEIAPDQAHRVRFHAAGGMKSRPLRRTHPASPCGRCISGSSRALFVAWS